MAIESICLFEFVTDAATASDLSWLLLSEAHFTAGFTRMKSDKVGYNQNFTTDQMTNLNSLSLLIASF